MNNMKEQNTGSFNKIEQMDQYRMLMKQRDQLKRIQQLSWNITQFDKKYPFENITPEQFDTYFKTYYEYAMDMFIINKVFGIILKEAKSKGLVPKA